MAVSKKIRFEVFKRDGFQCMYCGKSPPAVVLECDHIEPRSRGGKDDINNLATACFDCNRGKTHIPLNVAPGSLAENVEVLKEKEKQLAEYRKLVRKITRRVNKDIAKIDTIFRETFADRELTSRFKNTSVKQFLSKLPLSEVEDSMTLACERMDYPDNATKYFCGVCWRKIKAVQECLDDSR